jgi:hypothetical protein
MDEYIPNIPTDLVKFLEGRIPSKDFSVFDELRYIDFYSGQRAVVALLRQLHHEQVERSYSSTPNT